MPAQSPLDMMRAPVAHSRKSASGRARNSLWPIAAPVAIILALALAWVWLWYYAASAAGRTLGGWVEREAAAGRVYSCGAQSIGGFPLQIEARCNDAALEVKIARPPLTAKAQLVKFVAEVWHPTRLVGDIDGPVLLAETGQSASWIANWNRARVTVRGIPPDPEGFSVRIDGARVEHAGGSDSTLFAAKSADLQGRLAAGSPHDHPVIEVTLALAGATATAFHPLLAEPFDGEFDAVLRGFKDLAPKPWAERFREMQAAGDGGIEIKSLRLAQAKVIVVGTGKLNVNEHGKLDGVIQVAIVGIEHLVPLLGVDHLIGQGLDRLAGSDVFTQGASALDRMIPGLGGALRQSANAGIVESLKKMGQPSTIGKEPAIVLPLRFADGAVYLGMLRVGDLPAFF
jgi:hypothetical protein